MWNDRLPAEEPWTDGHIVPNRVLYEYDGPLVFTSKFGFIDAIFYKVDARDNGTDLFLATQISCERVDAVAEGQIAVRGAFMEEQYWLIETNPDLSVIRYWPCSREELPEDLLPESGVGLFAHHGLVPNTIEQATSFFSISFEGHKLHHSRMPFSTLKQLIVDSYDTARKILSPVSLAGTRSTVFDFDVAQPAFGSLIISLSEPVLNADAVKRRAKEQVNIRGIRGEFDAQRDAFFQEMGDIVDQAERGRVKDAEDRFVFLDQIQSVIPSQRSKIDRVQFSAFRQGKTQTLTVDEKIGDKIHAALREAEEQEVTETGNIEIINSRRQTFVLLSLRGKQVTCHVEEEWFEALQDDKRFRNGARLVVRGQLTRRPQRDRLDATRPPRILR